MAPSSRTLVVERVVDAEKARGGGGGGNGDGARRRRWW